MFEKVNLSKKIAQHVIDQCVSKGCQASVLIQRDNSLNVGVRKNELEDVQYNDGQTLNLRLYHEHKKMEVITSEFLDVAYLDQLVEKAYHMLPFVPTEEAFSLPPVSAQWKNNQVNLGIYNKTELNINALVESASACIALAQQKSNKVVDTQVRISGGENMVYYADSQGMSEYYMHTLYHKYIEVLAESNKKQHCNSDYVTVRDFSKMPSNQVLVDELVFWLDQKFNDQKIKSGEFPIVAVSDVAQWIIQSFLDTISGVVQYQKKSFLLDSIGQKIFPEQITITEKMNLFGGICTAPFDMEGVKTQDKCLIQKGVLNHYLLSHYTANKLNMKTTGNGGILGNVIVNPTIEANLYQLLEKMNTGYLVTHLIGEHSAINDVTGNYSVGSSGFWVENGKIQYPVREVTISGNIKDLFHNIMDVGSPDPVRQSNISIGPTLIKKVTLSSL